MPQQGRPSAGDMTGQAKMRNAKAAKEAAEERGAEISMRDAAVAHDEATGVFDAQSGERIDSAPDTRTAVMVEERPAPFFNARDTGEQILTGQEDPSEIEAIVAARKAFQAPPPQMVRSAMVTVRVDQDIDDMTYGMLNGEPNNYSFKEGLAYRIPLPVAEHLNERNLIRQWISG